MKKTEINRELINYQESFNAFVESKFLPAEWFEAPDHLAIKCANRDDYDETCETLSSQVDENGIWELEEKGRLLGSAQLIGSVTLSGHSFSWVEIMQPRPGKESNTGFVEHVEFYYPDLKAVEKHLGRRKVVFMSQGNGGHNWINIDLDEYGREIKINDKPLSDVVIWERDEGLLKPRGSS